MSRNLVILIILSQSVGLLGGVPDSASFTSFFERQLFVNLRESKPIDSIDLFIAPSFTDDKALIKEKVRQFVPELQKKMENYPVGKKVKTIYKEVHAAFLKHYSEQALFNDIISSGDYNCVSATALLAIILDMTGISYTIKETPTHVYLIADPGNTSFLMESTLPSDGVKQFDTRFRDNYIKYLHDNKIISDGEFSQTTTEELFEKYYLKDHTISLKKLAGIQYSNKGVFEYNKGIYQEALISFEKAYELYPADAIGFMLNNTLINLLDKEWQKKEFNGHILARFLNLAESNESNLQIGFDQFQNISSELMNTHPNEPAYTRYFSQLTARLAIKDQSDILRTYYFFKGYYDCMNFRYAKALASLKVAYDLNSENLGTRQLVTESVRAYLMNDRNYETAIDSLNTYFERFPFLKQNTNMVGYLDYAYVRCIGQYLMTDNLSSGLNRMKQYEAFLQSNPEYETKSEYVNEAYQQLASYYLRHQKVTEAEQSLRKGIRISPGSDNLKEMLRSLMVYHGGSYEYPELMDDKKPVKRYLLASAKARDRQEIINANVDKFLKNTWNLDKIRTDGREQNAPKEVKMIMILKDNNVLEMTAESENATGRWSYNASKCLLDLTVKGDPETVHIIITDITSGKLEGLMYMEDEYEESFEVLMIAPGK